MEEYGLLDLVKELRDYKPNKEWVDAFEEKYKEVIIEWDISINFHSFSNNNKYNARNKINILFKKREKGLYFVRNSRMRGYYILIHNYNYEDNTLEITIGIGDTAMQEWYGTGIYNEEVENAPYLEAVKKVEEDGEEFDRIDKTKCSMKIDLDKITENDLSIILWEYNNIIKEYPNIMNEYIRKEGNKDLRNYFIEFKTRGKSQGRTFTMYIWNYIKNNHGVYPNIQIKEERHENFVFEESEDFKTTEIQSIDNRIGKNVIIYGVPGSGKSYYIKNNILKNCERGRYERIIFHPEYSYYDFVGQRYPNENGGLIFVPGPFTRILEKALIDEENHYYLIIEELNRGNAEAIFGDIFHLLDRKHGNSDYTVSAQEISDYMINNEKTDENIRRKIKNKLKEGIYIPENISIYATVNNADQNVFNMDTAFGRRWGYKIRFCNPKDSDIDESAQIYLNGYIKGTKVKWNDFRTKINNQILNNAEIIYNAEDKRMGLFYIDDECLTFEITEDVEAREKFASKILKYLWADVFKDCRSKLFDIEKSSYLERVIENFIESGSFDLILNKEFIYIKEKEA